VIPKKGLWVFQFFAKEQRIGCNFLRKSKELDAIFCESPKNS